MLHTHRITWFFLVEVIPEYLSNNRILPVFWVAVLDENKMCQQIPDTLCQSESKGSSLNVLA